MHSVRLFHTTTANLADLENAANDWLQQTGAKVVSATGNMAPTIQQRRVGQTSETAFQPENVLLVLVADLPETKGPSE